ncbi:MAG TPA: ribosome biogenesis GTPase Der [Candidatus Eremiobacteraceae bacterium]|jgi:ribosome-associated GTPase EngA|nr:ribosome biogenesis GTPase Der [Candidatus Eremiobacteraceae bacterium]
MSKSLPSLVIVGRPNVGKSTLFNRLTGTRRAIVTNEPGITRDRIYGKAEWLGHHIEIVDTGGIVPDDKALIPTEILRQANIAIKKASLLVLVVDSQAGLTPLDEELARLLRATGKPFVVAVNKVDANSQVNNANVFHRLGAPIFPIAAEHGTGVDDLLDAALAQFGPSGAAAATKPNDPTSTKHVGAQHAAPQLGKISDLEAPSDSDIDPEYADAESEFADESADTNANRPVQVAIIGRPNVGKSTLLNRMVGEERSIVSPIPGTTMDSVDTEVEHEGHFYNFVDTAGIRRKGKTTLVAEKLSVVMARRGLERCDVALLVVDSEQGVTQGDAQIANYAEQSGRSVIIVMNKWDLAVEAARKAAERDAATSKGQARRDAHDRRTEAAAKFSTTAQSRAKFKAGEARASASRANRGKGHSNKAGPREYSYPGATQGVHGFGDQDKSRLLFDYEKLVRDKLKFLSYAPIVFLSAKSGDRASKLFPLIDLVIAARRKRIPTPELNRWLKEDIDLQRGTTPKARPVKIYYMTQAKTSPPTFLLFTNQKDPLHFSYQRFLENQIREKWDFPGAPIRFIQRLRKAERDTRSEKKVESRAEAREAERKKHGPRLMREHETKELDD